VFSILTQIQTSIDHIERNKSVRFDRTCPLVQKEFTYINSRPYYLHQNDWMTVQLVERMKNVAWSSAIIDVNATTVPVSSDHINITARWHKINKRHSDAQQDIKMHSLSTTVLLSVFVLRA